MNYKETISQIETVLHELKTLKADYLKLEKLSAKAMNVNPRDNTIMQIQKASTDLNWQCMHLHKQKKRVWKAIMEADLKCSLEETEYNPSGFHSYKG